MKPDPKAQAAMQAMQEMLPDEYAGVQRMELMLEMAAGMLALPLEVFLHRRFGQRYLTPAAFTFLLVGLPIIANQVEPEPGLKQPGLTGFLLWLGSTPLRVMVLACLALALFHLFETWRTIRRGEHVHTRYSGTPHAFWWKLLDRLNQWVEVDEFFIKRYAEPLAVILLGILAQFISGPLGTCLLVGGLVLGLKTHLEYARMKGRILDMLDGMTEGQALRLFVNPGKPKPVAAGFVFPAHAAAKPVLIATLETPSVQDSIQGLAKELKVLMGVPEPPPEPVPPPEKHRVECPHCGKRGKLPPESLGRTVRCGGCKQRFRHEEKEEVTHA